jgi:hypothetical protein
MNILIPSKPLRWGSCFNCGGTGSVAGIQMQPTYTTGWIACRYVEIPTVVRCSECHGKGFRASPERR